jgi:hypothetical protein
VIVELATTTGASASVQRAAHVTGQESLVAATPQERALADWQRRVALDLQLLDL